MIRTHLKIPFLLQQTLAAWLPSFARQYGYASSQELTNQTHQSLLRERKEF